MNLNQETEERMISGSKTKLNGACKMEYLSPRLTLFGSAMDLTRSCGEAVQNDALGKGTSDDCGSTIE